AIKAKHRIEARARRVMRRPARRALAIGIASALRLLELEPNRARRAFDLFFLVRHLEGCRRIRVQDFACLPRKRWIGRTSLVYRPQLAPLEKHGSGLRVV